MIHIYRIVFVSTQKTKKKNRSKETEIVCNPTDGIAIVTGIDRKPDQVIAFHTLALDWSQAISFI